MTKSAAAFLAATLCCAAGAVLAQSAAPTVIEDFKPSSLNQPGQQYPQVNSQGYVRFHIVAPDARKVHMNLGLGGQGSTELAKGPDGAWTATTAGPLDQGFHIII